MTTSTTEPARGSALPADHLQVRGIEVFAHHGVFEAERRDGQRFLIDLDLTLETAQAAATDDLELTVDYGLLVTDVVEAVASDPVDLIETVAERVAAVCLARQRVLCVAVTVHKPDAPIPTVFTDVALTINRRRA